MDKNTYPTLNSSILSFIIYITFLNVFVIIFFYYSYNSTFKKYLTSFFTYHKRLIL